MRLTIVNLLISERMEGGTERSAGILARKLEKMNPPYAGRRLAAHATYKVGGVSMARRVALTYPPLEGEGRLAWSEAKSEPGWRGGLSTRALLETRDRHPTPPLISFASTLPLQGRVKATPPSC